MKAKIAMVALTVLAVNEAKLRAQDINSLLSEWNVVTAGNLEMVNDIQGAAYVGGNVTVPNSFNVATGNSAIPTSEISLAVGGNIEAGGNIQVNGGSVVAGGTISSTINMNSHGTQTQDDPAGLPASPVAQITSASQYWSGLAANSSTAVADNEQLDFNCAANSSLAVFNVSASMMSGSAYHGFTLMPSSATGDVLINVNAQATGGVVNWTTGSFLSQFNTPYWDGRVLFNFYNATSVTLSGLIGGYVVAPNANVIEDNNIDGGVMADNLTVNSEVDLPESGSASAWDGDLPNVVVAPEPSTAVPGAGAMAMAVLSLWRGKRKLA
jgi:choice-of-anchor A domain-containing protein